MPKTAKTATATVLDPAIEAGRLVSTLWSGTLEPKDRDAIRARLEVLDCVWCPTCFAYLMAGHTCWTPAVAQALRDEVLATAARRREVDAINAAHDEALRDEHRLGQSMWALGRALRLDEEAPAEIDGPAEVEVETNITD